MIEFLSVKSRCDLRRAERLLCADGLFFFCDIETEQDAIDFAAHFGDIVPHRDSEPSGITRICHSEVEPVSDAYRGFSSAALFPHTDRSSLQSPPPFLMQVCYRQSGIGGESTLVNIPKLLAVVSEQDQSVLEVLQDPTHAIISDGKTTYRGPLLEQAGDGSLSFRFRNDNCIYMTPRLSDVFGRLLREIERLTMTCKLPEGCGYLVHNGWWLHGRTAFSGPREMWRILLDGHKGASWSGKTLAGFSREILCV